MLKGEVVIRTSCLVSVNIAGMHAIVLKLTISDQVTVRGNLANWTKAALKAEKYVLCT